MTWSHFSHGADLGVRGTGATKALAFEDAATALTAAITDPATVAASESFEIHCEAPDDELLLVDWLNALIYEMAVRQMLFSSFSVELDDGRLTAKVSGEAVDRSKHHPAVEVKGATLTALSVRESDGGWIAECVVDV